jgi:hypothetical protein
VLVRLGAKSEQGRSSRKNALARRAWSSGSIPVGPAPALRRSWLSEDLVGRPSRGKRTAPRTHKGGRARARARDTSTSTHRESLSGGINATCTDSSAQELNEIGVVATVTRRPGPAFARRPN